MVIMRGSMDDDAGFSDALHDARTRPVDRPAGHRKYTRTQRRMYSGRHLRCRLRQTSWPAGAMHGILMVVPFLSLYPLMKRWTWWPQAWLGLTLNWGAWIIWYALKDHAEGSGMQSFFAGLVSWTIFYDTIYACQDRKDDVKAGVKSTALLFGTWVRPILSCFALVFLASLVYAGFCNGKGLPFYLVSCGGALAHIGWQLATWDPNDPKDCGAKFKSNGDMGYVIWGGLLLDFYLNPTYVA
ncbi:hypothetical protein EVG20_g7505 [Dentipellis fragilis]|uniref:4-hydroxybenzoate polyprenyltransferase, mitochondrial n=1 Tax=Dentipellis fragilis TaxID=205917 RepID=A0A4Y9YCE2_9AGAM|nr:hypothetical protein EVG20_g7505 [Dentipellis fragilis]